MSLKLYTVVHAGLEPGAKAAQASHALAEFALDHPDEFLGWDNGIIVILESSNLRSIVRSAEDGGFVFSTFIEPDPIYIEGSWPFPSRNQLTAVTFAPNWLVQNVLLSDLPLALRQKPKKRGWFR